jgi:hypothetical protein
MALPPPKVCRKILKLYALVGSASEEGESARKKIIELLSEYGCNWNHIDEIRAAMAAGSAAQPPSPHQPSDQTSDQPEVNVFDLVRRLFELHIFVSSEERTAFTLWVLHCWVFNRFTHSPRLALISPVRGCGKTETLALIEQLAPNSWRVDDVTPASIYRQRQLPTFLLDEFDQVNLRHNGTLKAVLHSGWSAGGGVSRFIDGWPQLFEVYAPVALAAIGAHSLSLPLLDRSIVIRMHKTPADVSNGSRGTVRFLLRRASCCRSGLRRCSLT